MGLLTGFFSLVGIKDGTDATFRRIDCNIAAIVKTADNVQKAPAEFSLVEVIGDVEQPFNAYLRISILKDGGELVHTDYSGLRSGLSYNLPADRYGDADMVRLSAYDDAACSRQVAVKDVMVVTDNPIPFPREDEWNAANTYKNGEYHLLDGIVYMWRNPVPGNSVLAPPEDVKQNPLTTSWAAYQNWPLLCTGMLLSDFAKIGQAVFAKNYTISQQGEGEGDYRDFDLATGGGTFRPNIIIDWVAGTMRLLKLVAEGADVTGKLTANAGSTIGGMTSYTNFLRYMETLKEAIGGSELERQVVAAMGNSCLPSSSARHCNLYIKDETTGTFKSLVYIDSAPTADNISASITDYRDFNRAIDIEQGTLRVARGNLVDMPGVLLAGRVGEMGGTLWNFGKRRVSSGKYAFLSARTGSNNNYEYTITHNLGHLNYAVSVTPFITGTWRKVHAVVTAQSANSFTVRLIDSGTENDGEAYPFMFVVVGEN